MKIMQYVLPIICVGLSSCSYISSSSIVRNHDKAYLQARSIAPIRVPPGLSSSAINTTYPIPDRDYPNGTKNISLVPPGLDH